MAMATTRVATAAASKASLMVAFLTSSTAKMKKVATLAGVATISSNRTRSPSTMVVHLHLGTSSNSSSNTLGLRLLILQARETLVALLSVSITLNSTGRFPKLEVETLLANPKSLRSRR